MPEPNWAWAAGCITSARTRARVAKTNFFTESSLETLWNGVVGIRGKEHVLREIHFHAVSLPNRDGGRNLNEAVKDRCGGLRNTRCGANRERLGATRGNGPAPLRDLAGSGDHTQSDRGAEDLKVVVVDPGASSGFRSASGATRLLFACRSAGPSCVGVICPGCCACSEGRANTRLEAKRELSTRSRSFAAIIWACCCSGVSCSCMLPCCICGQGRLGTHGTFGTAAPVGP